MGGTVEDYRGKTSIVLTSGVSVLVDRCQCVTPRRPGPTSGSGGLSVSERSGGATETPSSAGTVIRTVVVFLDSVYCLPEVGLCEFDSGHNVSRNVPTSSLLPVWSVVCF